jgi:hypothetical protein
MKLLATMSCLTVATALVAAETPELVWETGGFVGPESIVLDTARGEYYVSNMGTFGEGATPGDGFISRVSLDGKILELKWVTGFADPKGLALANGRLYVGDDPGLAEVDIATGKIHAWHAPEDGKGDFNDCTADADGNVYVSSGRLGTIFRLRGGNLEAWHKLDRSKTGWLNGLKAEKDRLLLGGWSLRVADGTEQLGHISTISFADQSLGRLGTEPVCHVDGLEPDGRGGYTVTDWLTGDAMHVTADGKPTKIMNLGQGTADHAYVIDEKLLLIPQMMENKVRAYRWSPAE